MLQKLGINPPPINFRRPARAAADGESVLSGDTGCSSFTKSEAALLGLPVPLKSPQSLAPRLPSAAKVVAWRQGARYYSSPANKTRMFKVLKHQYGSVKQQTNKENVSPSVLKQCYDKSETLLNPAQKINATVSKIPRRRLQFEENGNQLKELQEGKATEINNNHIATDSSDEEQPLSVLKKSLKVSDGEQPLSVRNKTLKVSDGEHPLSVLKKTLKVGESETTQTAPLIKKVQDPSKVNKSTCGKKASANSDKQCISVSTKVPPPTSKPKNPSKGQKNTCGKKPSAIAQKQSTSVSTKVPPPTSKPKNLSKGQKSTCEKKPSANAQKQSISVSTKVPPPTSKPKNPPKVNKSTSAKKTTANAQKQCRSVSTKVPQPTSKSEVQSQKVKEASEKSESSDEEASLATLKEQLVERNTFACIDQTVPKNPSKEKSKLPFLKLKELQNVDASSSRKVIMKEGNGSKDNFVFTVPSSTPKTKPMVPMDFSKKSEQRNKTTSNDLSLLDLSVPLDFSKNSEKNDSIPTSNDMSLLDLSAIESSLDLSIKGKPSVRKTFSLSSINQDDSSTINISAASSSSTGRALRSRNLQKRPIYALTSDEEEEEILDLEGETEWRVNDPTINECKNNATQDSDISSGDSSEDEIIVTLPKKQLGKKWKNKLAPSSGMKEVSNGASNWIREDIFKPVQQPVLIPPPQEEMREPLAYFQYFFDTDLLESIVHYTNLYSTWKEGGEKCINLTKTELEQFFGVWMYMGINSLPGIRDYWASETLVNQVASTMSFNRFQRIRSHLHMYDKTQESSLPTNDRFAKVRLVLDKMKMKCNDLNQEQNYSIDETMVPYKGRFAGSLRQFIRNKPHRFGVKIFNLAGSSGIIYDFLPYAGSDTFRGIDFTPKRMQWA